ncbi:hypothetical protein AYO40_01720 [Planctomycetaceae bacterium SCGC AG-212-D15]|nr:hypothetical protein AYO40_01720 [Planctomycetaceae bacterium SCGC AG-212-D15]
MGTASEIPSKQERFMAKKSGTSKSAAIREILSKDPTTLTSEIASKLGVSPTLVYLVKSKMGRKSRRAKHRAIASTNKVGMTNPVEMIVELKKLAEQIGGMKNLARLCEVLA